MGACTSRLADVAALHERHNASADIGCDEDTVYQSCLAPDVEGAIHTRLLECGFVDYESRLSTYLIAATPPGAGHAGFPQFSCSEDEPATP